jgi:hypothetical protein
MVDRADAIAAPTEPFAGVLIEGGFGMPGVTGFGTMGTEDVWTTPVKVMVGSSAIIASNKPAQPGCRSTALGS